MPGVLIEDPAQVGLVEDQDPVQDLPPQGSDEPFADRVRPRRLGRALDDVRAVGGEDGVEAGVELAVAIPHVGVHVIP